MPNKMYALPDLPYAYNALAPQISEEQLKIHHLKHHQAYITGANGIFEKIDKARKEKTDFDVKAVAKELSWNIAGHLMHYLFWTNMAPAGKGGGGKPSGKLAEAIEKEFGSFERFKDEFTKAAVGVEGSGWAVLTYCKLTERPIIMQVEKHNVNVIPHFHVLLVLDVFEHAYYIDYKNLRAKFVEAFWDIVNWAEAEKRFAESFK